MDPDVDRAVLLSVDLVSNIVLLIHYTQIFEGAAIRVEVKGIRFFVEIITIEVEAFQFGKLAQSGSQPLHMRLRKFPSHVQRLDE